MESIVAQHRDRHRELPFRLPPGTADCFTESSAATRICEPAMGQSTRQAGNMVVVQGSQGILNPHASRTVDSARA
jgi:hypothetical protein